MSTGSIFLGRIPHMWRCIRSRNRKPYNWSTFAEAIRGEWEWCRCLSRIEL